MTDRLMLLMGILVALNFFEVGRPEKGAQFFLGGCDLHRSYGMVVIVLSFFCNYDNLTLQLHQKNAAT